MSRLEPAIIAVLFCLPLFIGLGQGDLKNDEAIYSYAVDSILEDGDWMAPKSSPNPHIVFLEKPPLKFWIVAAPIRAGLLPHDEFGLRFWDALFGGIAFLYVYALGRRIAGPICGAVAVLLLFVHEPLVFVHGLRENNMEAALLLAYCGGIYHFLRWMESGGARPPRVHAVAVAGYFTLGFLTKFVAALFLPLVLGAAALIVPEYRARLRSGFRHWVLAAGVAAAAIVPWFAYAHFRFGRLLWEVMFRDHVYHRFTAGVDPSHVQPRWFYVDMMQIELESAHAFGLVGFGLVLFAVETIRRRWPPGVLMLCWFLIPLGLLSSGTSKLYHYAYPFLPPLAIAGGYLPAMFWQTLRAGLGAAPQAMEGWSGRRSAAVLAFVRRRHVRLTLAVLAITSAVLALVTVATGPVRVDIGSVTLFRNSSVLRPALVGLVLAILAGVPPKAMGLALLPLLILLLPVPAYRDMLARLGTEPSLLRPVRDCVLELQARHEIPRLGVYAEMPEKYYQHGYYYYLRALGPWERVEAPNPARLYERLFDPSQQRPVLVTEAWYSDFRQQLRAGKGPAVEQIGRRASHDPAALREHAVQPSPPMVDFTEILLLLPGRLGTCAPGVTSR